MDETIMTATDFSEGDVRRLADALAAVLRDWLTPSEWDDMHARNTQPDYAETGSCASHDFCDANMAMAAAFRRAFQRSPDIQDQAEGAEGPDVRLWNAAWADASVRHLTSRRGG